MKDRERMKALWFWSHVPQLSVKIKNAENFIVISITVYYGTCKWLYHYLAWNCDELPVACLSVLLIWLIRNGTRKGIDCEMGGYPGDIASDWFIWEVTLCWGEWFPGFWRNVRNHSSNNIVSHPRRPESWGINWSWCRFNLIWCAT